MNKIEEFEKKLGSLALELEVMKVEAMQAEIERIEAEECEPEIPPGALCHFWNEGDGREGIDILERKLKDVPGAYVYITHDGAWEHARIANDIPGVMVWQKHDGGPCPVGVDARVVTLHENGGHLAGRASLCGWGKVAAYAIINKADWMDS